MIRQSLIFNKPLSWDSVILTLVFMELSKDRLFKRNDFGILEQIFSELPCLLRLPLRTATAADTRCSG